ncbi:MAG: hypothetical protein NUV72_08635, partial [Bauldia sp.]|nr:hypothetical protein [Bauldia sp.]
QLNDTALAANDILANKYYELYYDGTAFQLTRLSAAAGVSASSTDTFTNKTIDADGTGNAISNIDIGNAIAASQAEAEAGTDNTKLVTALRVAQAIAALAPAQDVAAFIITHTADTALATRATGGTQIGATLAGKTIPTAGFIRVTVVTMELDETEGSAAAIVAIGLDVGGTLVWAAVDVNAGTATDAPDITVNTSVASRLVGAGSNSAIPLIATFDIVAGSFPTGAQDVKFFMGDNANSSTGEATVTGTTVTARILVEIIDCT